MESVTHDRDPLTHPGGAEVAEGAQPTHQRASLGLADHDFLAICADYPGNGLVVHLLFEARKGEDFFRYLMCSSDQTALLIHASEIANGRPVMLWDMHGVRQAGGVAHANKP